MMSFLREIPYLIRFDIVQAFWKPTNHSAKPRFLQNLINRYWTPTNAINVSGQNSGRNLTDVNLAYDLPFLMATNSGIIELDLSHNQVGLKTIANIDKGLFRTSITALNLSHNPLDEAAKSRLGHLLSNTLSKVNLSHCNLSEQDIAKLLVQLNKTPDIVELDVSNNNATQAQLDEINTLLIRNKAYNTFKAQQKAKVLDLERHPLDAQGINDLAFYISKNVPFFFLAQGNVNEIKAPNIAQGLKDADFEPLIQALNKNNGITDLTMDFRQVSDETAQKIKTQLMLNNATAKMKRKLNSFSFFLVGFTGAAFILEVTSAFSFGFAFAAVVIARLAYNSYYFKQLQQAKTADFTQPENVQAIECGINAARSNDLVASYLNPKLYTPMSNLGYVIEKEKLNEKYSINNPAVFKKNRA